MAPNFGTASSALDILASCATSHYTKLLENVLENRFDAKSEEYPKKVASWPEHPKKMEDTRKIRFYKAYIVDKLRNNQPVPVILYPSHQKTKKMMPEDILKLDHVSDKYITYKNHAFTFQIQIKSRLTGQQIQEALEAKANLEKTGLNMTRAQSGEGEFDCPLCEEPSKFARNSSLTYHLMCHINFWIYRCDQCHDVFRHKTLFEEHLRRQGHSSQEDWTSPKNLYGLLRTGFEAYNLKVPQADKPESWSKKPLGVSDKFKKVSAHDLGYSSSPSPPSTTVQRASYQMPDIPQENRLSVSASPGLPQPPAQPQQIYTKRENKENIAPRAKRVLASNQPPLQPQECQGAGQVGRRRSAEPSHVLYPGNYDFPSRALVPLPPSGHHPYPPYELDHRVPPRQVVRYSCYINGAAAGAVNMAEIIPQVQSEGDQVFYQSHGGVQNTTASARPNNTYINCNGINISNPFNRRSF